MLYGILIAIISILVSAGLCYIGINDYKKSKKEKELILSFGDLLKAQNDRFEGMIEKLAVLSSSMDKNMKNMISTYNEQKQSTVDKLEESGWRKKPHKE